RNVTGVQTCALPISFTIGSLQHHLTTAPTSLLIHPRENHAESLVYHLQKHYAEAIEQRRWEAPWHIIEIVKKGMNKAVGLQKIEIGRASCRERGKM